MTTTEYVEFLKKECERVDSDPSLSFIEKMTPWQRLYNIYMIELESMIRDEFEEKGLLKSSEETIKEYINERVYERMKEEAHVHNYNMHPSEEEILKSFSDLFYNRIPTNRKVQIIISAKNKSRAKDKVRRQLGIEKEHFFKKKIHGNKN